MTNYEREPSPYFTEDQLAERWGVSKRTLQGHRYRDKGRALEAMSGPPWVSIGGAVRYRLCDITAYEMRHHSTAGCCA
jgi:hypothetical protein